MHEFTNQDWFTMLSQDLQLNVTLSFTLYERENELRSQLGDYSFVVFPISKAYEGYLKSYFFSLNLISKELYEGTRFRIGRALNPDIRDSHRDEFWLYDEVTQLCGEQIARQLWQAWLECRNRVFHYYPHKNTILTLTESHNRITQVVEAMQAATECKIADLKENTAEIWNN